MTQETTSPRTAAPAKLQASVDYLPGITIAGSRSALLEWSADDRIKFFIMDANFEKAEEILFDVPVKEIEKIRGGVNMLTFVVAGKKYNALFSRTAALKLSIGGGIGLGAAYADIQATGVMQWVAKFRENKIDMAGFRDVTWVAKTSLIGAGIAVGIALLVVLVIAISAAVNAPVPQ